MGRTSASRTGSSCVRSPVTGTTMTAATTITATTTAARAQASTTTTVTTTATTTAVPAPAQAPATTTAATAAAVATRTTRPGSRGRGNSPRQAAAISSTSSALAGCAAELPREREAIHAGEGFSQLAPALAGVFGQVHPPVALAHRHQVASGHQAERVDVVRERHREPRLAPAGREGPVRIVDRPPVDGRLVRGRSGRGAGQQPAVRQGHGPAVAGVQPLGRPVPRVPAVEALAHTDGGGHGDGVPVGQHLVVVGLGRNDLDPLLGVPPPHAADVHAGERSAGAHGERPQIGRRSPRGVGPPTPTPPGRGLCPPAPAPPPAPAGSGAAGRRAGPAARRRRATPP